MIPASVVFAIFKPINIGHLIGATNIWLTFSPNLYVFLKDFGNNLYQILVDQELAFFNNF